MQTLKEYLWNYYLETATKEDDDLLSTTMSFDKWFDNLDTKIKLRFIGVWYTNEQNQIRDRLKKKTPLKE